MSDAHALPPVSIVVSHRVADFDTWKKVFDASEQPRKAAGILGHHINRGKDDPNSLDVYLAASDLERAKEFSTSDELKATMQQAGVTSAPRITWMTPVRESIVWDRQLPAFLLSHSVADFDSWLVGYDAADELRSSRGIVGHAANQSMEDSSVAVVYHQAESFEALQSFLADEELAAAMKEAGVTSEPQVTLHTGGWAKQY